MSQLRGTLGPTTDHSTSDEIACLVWINHYEVHILQCNYIRNEEIKKGPVCRAAQSSNISEASPRLLFFCTDINHMEFLSHYH